MAIHPEFPGLSVKIRVKKRGCHEYNVPADAGEDIPDTTVVKYVEATPETSFQVPMRIDPSSFKYARNDVQCEIEVDGVLSTTCIASKEDYAKDGNFDMGGIDAVQGDPLIHRAFMFSKLDTGLFSHQL